MSNALAIAAVTESLVALLSDYLPLAQVQNASVSTVTPDQEQGRANPGVNVFLYQVSPNTALRNADLPTRAPDGTLLKKPQAAIDLHYLFTFYGDDTLLEQQRLLGAVTLTLHRFPNLQRNQVQPVPIGPGVTAPSNLDTQSELVRFTPVSFSLEEMSKLWSFLLKVDYVLSAAYVGSVVLMDADDATPPPALPALSYRVRALPTRQPTINQIVASPDPNAPITMGTDIALLGSNLAAQAGGATQVLISGITQPPATITANRITLALPAGLSAGAQTAQVLQPVSLGSPPVSHPGTGSASNLAAFVLNPMIAAAGSPGGYAITVLPGYGSPPGLALHVTLVPVVQAGQRAVLQMLPQGAPANGQLFDGGTLTEASDTVTFPITGLAPGNYIVRVLIDGAETPVIPGPGGVPVEPLVTV